MTYYTLTNRYFFLFSGFDSSLTLFISNTIDSRYLEFQGTLWNTLRYPYLDIPDLQNWGEKIEQPHLTNLYVIGLLKIEIFWKYCGKGEKFLRSNFSSFPQYILPVVRFACLGREIFTSKVVIRDKRGRDNEKQVYSGIVSPYFLDLKFEMKSV